MSLLAKDWVLIQRWSRRGFRSRSGDSKTPWASAKRCNRSPQMPVPQMDSESSHSFAEFEGKGDAPNRTISPGEAGGRVPCRSASLQLSSNAASCPASLIPWFGAQTAVGRIREPSTHWIQNFQKTRREFHDDCSIDVRGTVLDLNTFRITTVVSVILNVSRVARTTRSDTAGTRTLHAPTRITLPPTGYETPKMRPPPHTSKMVNTSLLVQVYR